MKKEFYEAFCTISMYNGYKEYFLELIRYMEQQMEIKESNGYKYNFIPTPQFITILNDTERIEHVFWSILVLMYGCYGTSPRYGWIEDYEGAKNFINNIILEIESDGVKE